MLRRVATPSAVLLALASAACLGPNPLLDGSGDGESAGDEATANDDDEATQDSDDETDETDETGEPDSCSNGTRDGDESDVDCGGSCSACADGADCEAASDCQSQVCTASSCAAPSCSDGVQNGDERELDCGGSACRLCSIGGLLAELDDFSGATLAQAPYPAMFDDHQFALTFSGPTNTRLRWFDADGQPLGSSVPLANGVTSDEPTAPVPIVAHLDDRSRSVTAALLGTNAESTSADLFLLRRTPALTTLDLRVNPLDQVAGQAAMILNGSVLTLAWEVEERVVLRRFDFSVGNGQWIDITPLAAETLPDQSGASPGLVRTPDGITLLAWRRCPGSSTVGCNLVLRRFDDVDWVDPNPVVITDQSGFYSSPRMAVGEDGRIGLVWYWLILDNLTARMAILDEGLEVEGQPWNLANNAMIGPFADIVAVPGGFAVAWNQISGDDGFIRLRRYGGADEPLIPGLEDEATWPAVEQPGGVRMAQVDRRILVTWSAVVDGVRQVQGQVLAY